MLAQQRWARREALAACVHDDAWDRPSALFATDANADDDAAGA